MSSIEEKRKSFDETDKDKDGFVTIGELKTSLGASPKISDDNVAAVVKIADDDDDRLIDFDEYARLVR